MISKFKTIILKSKLLSCIYQKLSLRETKFIAKYREKNDGFEQYLKIPEVFLENTELPSGFVVGIVRDKSVNNYFRKYVRFLESNHISYEFYDLESDSFIRDAKKYDLIIFRPTDKIPDIRFQKEKVYYLEKYISKTIFPSYHDLWAYESKQREYYLLANTHYPLINTFFSNSYLDCLNFAKRTEYPIVSKEITSYSSMGVKLIKNYSTARRFIDEVFSFGRRSSIFWEKQKNYCYFQEFINDAVADIRIICIGGKYFAGYYRYAKKGDFRASGSGLLEKKELPKELLAMTLSLYGDLKIQTMLAVDYIQNVNKQYKIIEYSSFFGIETPEQLLVNGIPGLYHYNGLDFQFKPGIFWLQELSLKCYFEKYYRRKQ